MEGGLGEHGAKVSPALLKHVSRGMHRLTGRMACCNISKWSKLDLLVGAFTLKTYGPRFWDACGLSTVWEAIPYEEDNFEQSEVG